VGEISLGQMQVFEGRVKQVGSWIALGGSSEIDGWHLLRRKVELTLSASPRRAEEVARIALTAGFSPIYFQRTS
jgi:hypothetical protein